MTDLDKDLLQEVIGKEYKILKITKHSITVIHEEAFNSVEWCEHKVAHKCKEWANNVLDKYDEPGYVLTSKNLEIFDSKFSNAPIINKAVCYIGLLILVDTYGTSGDLQFKHYTQADSEPKAIFKATQWISDNKD